MTVTELICDKRHFAYLRVSTPEQTTENQVQEITASGFRVEPHRIVTETVSGSVAIGQRPEFARLADRLEPGDVLVVTKLDRLGRNAMDVAATVAGLDKAGIKVHCMALGGVDLTSAAGKLTMYVINAVAEFERDLLIERTQAGPSPRHVPRQASWPAAPPFRRGAAVGARTPCNRRQHLLARPEIRHQPPDHHAREGWGSCRPKLIPMRLIYERRWNERPHRRI